MVSLSTTDDPVNSFEARRRYLEGNIKSACEAMNRCYALLGELRDAHGVAIEHYEAHLRGSALTEEQATREYARGKAAHAAIEAANDVALAIKMAREAVVFAERLKAEADAAKRNV